MASRANRAYELRNISPARLSSVGAVFPPAVLKALGLKAGQPMTMGTTADGKITLSPKRKYTLSELIAECDRKAKPPADMAIWHAARPVGQETL